MKKRFARLAAGLLCATVASAASAGSTILQWYESKWETIEKKMPDAYVAGYSAFWFPPCYKGDTGGFTVGYDVYDRFNLGTAFDQTLYGTESSLKNAIDIAHRAGMQVYLDWIGNHNGFRSLSTPGFDAAGGYPGFVLTLPGDVDGDFHGAYASGDIEGRLAGLIDIAQEKNHVFIRHPIVAGPTNIPRQNPNPNNAKFYPDQALAANYLGIKPFNKVAPLAGDPVAENATGLLLRNVQWLIEVVGADGLRLDATKHIPPWFFSSFYDNVMKDRGKPDFNGNPTTPFSFGENFDTNFANLNNYVRKDGFGNRDTLDFPIYYAMQSVFDGVGFNSMAGLEYASYDGSDGNYNDGTRGVMFAGSHDNFGPAFDNDAYAHILTRAGYPIVYFNALEFGTGRDFPKGGRGDALGGDYGNVITNLVDVNRRYGKGTHKTRWVDTNTYVYERSKSLVVGISNRADSGYDSRTVQTDFAAGTVLTELSGTARDFFVDPFDDIFDTVTVNGSGQITIRIPRNKINSNFHKRGYVCYGMPTPTMTQTIAPVSTVLAPETTATANGVRRHTPIQVVTGTTFSVTLQTTSSGVLDDNALIKFDGGVNIDANAGIFVTGGEFAGFEQFTDQASPRFGGGTGTYKVTVNTTGIAEGMHFIDTIAFVNRTGGDPATYSSIRSAIYLDRSPPPVTLVYPTTTGTSDVVTQSFTVVAQCPDYTANSMHIFFDQIDGYNYLANVNGGNAMTRVDRNEFRYTWNNITAGNHKIAIVAFEQTGNSSVTIFQPVNTVLPAPPMALGIDTDSNPNAVTFTNMPLNLLSNTYANDIVVRVDTTGGKSFPADFDVTLDVDGTSYTAVAYNAGLLPPIGRLVQNDQNLGDQYDEFRFRWVGYSTGIHSFTARAVLKNGTAPANSVQALVSVSTGVGGPALTINSPAPGTTYNQPTSVTLNVTTDNTARSLLGYISNGQQQQLIQSINLPPTTTQNLSTTVSNYLVTDNVGGLNLTNGTYTLRALAATGTDGTGIVTEKVTSITITGFPADTPTTHPVVDGNIAEFFDRSPLAVSAVNGGPSSPSSSISDFGADGSLMELHGRIANNTLYMAVRGDIFNGGNPANNATIVYIDVDTTAGTGAKNMYTTSDLSDNGTAMRTLVTNSGFKLNSAMISAGRGFDAAVIINAASPLDYKIFGLGTAGVSGATNNFAELQGTLAFGSGFGSYPGATGTIVNGPTGFEFAIPLSQLGNANPLDMSFAVVTTSDGSFPSPNSLPENAQNTFDAVQTLDGLAQFPKYARLKINEVNTGVPDWVEIYNPTTGTVALTNWKLRWADGSGYSNDLGLDALSVGASGGYALAYDASPKPGAALLLSGNLPWSKDRPGAASLIDPYGIAIDYVRWSSLGGTALFGADPGAGTYYQGDSTGFDSDAGASIGRSPASLDTDNAPDLYIMGPSPGAVNHVAAVDVSEWSAY
ncbi:MAG: hypothetical protein K1X53_17625 [Candidatus Sumerlaeaceae bacterium]|nr:hypothetical protein [Candidatus Sumerlaeaceae bacterium]